MKGRNVLTTMASIFSITLFAHGGAAAPPEPEEASTASGHRAGVLVMAHGGDEAWDRAVEAVVDPLREHYPIEIAFGMARPSTMQAAVDRLEKRGVERIAVVRMYISAESFLERTQTILGLRREPSAASNDHASDHNRDSDHGDDFDRHASHDGSEARDSPEEETSAHGGGHGMEPARPIDVDASVVMSRTGLSESPIVDEILLDRVEALSLDPSRESLLVVAHGPGDDDENERWLAAMRQRTELLQEHLPFVDVRCETLREDWPEHRAPAEERIRKYVQAQSRAGRRVLVVPFRVAEFGPFPEVLDGLSYVADGRGFCPHPHMARWIDQTARRLISELPECGFERPAEARDRGAASE